MVPEKLKGTEFEGLLLDAAQREERAGRLTMGRYGVKAVTLGKGKTITVPSLPDFEGALALPVGRQFIIEAKTNEQTSLQMHPKIIKDTQVKHLIDRSKFGVLSFLVIHWNARKLINSNHPGFTVAVPVTDADPRWQAFVDACAKFKADKREHGDAAKFESQPALTRDDTLRMGKVIPWRIPKGCRKSLPDLLSFLDVQGLLRSSADSQPTLL